jgi:hypothetical protein
MTQALKLVVSRLSKNSLLLSLETTNLTLTIKILQSLCVSHKIVETYRNQHTFRSRDERKRAENM